MSYDTVLILANGEWEPSERLAHRVAEADWIVAANGGWAKAAAAGLQVDCVVGDLDSLTPQQRATVHDSGVGLQLHPTNKDLTDLELAVDDALARGARRLVVVGAFGDRVDHTLANVLMLEKAARRGVHVELLAAGETAWIVRSPFVLPFGNPGDRVSLLPLTDVAVVSTHGLRYRLDERPLVRASAHGISNVIETVPVGIAVRSGTLLVVHGKVEEEGANGQ